MISDHTQEALGRARAALEAARQGLREDGEWWASRDVDQALQLVRQAIAEVETTSNGPGSPR